jgi:hypothetical protein
LYRFFSPAIDKGQEQALLVLHSLGHNNNHIFPNSHASVAPLLDRGLQRLQGDSLLKRNSGRSNNKKAEPV